MTTINSKMGLKPRTRARAATHSSGLVTGAVCPTCGCGHVVEHEVHGRALRLCGSCGDTWEPTEDEARVIVRVDAGLEDDERGAA